MCDLRGSVKEAYERDLIFYLIAACQAGFGLMGKSKEKKKLARVLVPSSIAPSEELIVRVSIDVPYT